jgi:hypothetical protein
VSDAPNVQSSQAYRESVTRPGAFFRSGRVQPIFATARSNSDGTWWLSVSDPAGAQGVRVNGPHAPGEAQLTRPPTAS